jgi:glycosyltransferase 2 family protein
VSGRLLRPLLLTAGLAFVAWLVWDLGPAAVWATIHALSWWLALLVLFPFCLAVVVDTLGWRVLLPGCPVSWGALAGARLAGEAVNLATPTASVGGEPLKAYLVRDRLTLGEGLASVVVDKTTVVLGQAAFLGAGLGLALIALKPPEAVAIAMAALLGAEVVAVGGFALVQIRGGVAGGGRLLSRLGLGPADRYLDLLGDVDGRLARVYRERLARVLLSALLHALGWAVGGLEIYLVLTLAGMPVNLATALVLEAVSSAVRFATFMIPGSLGAIEGGNVAVFAAFGLPGAAGLSFSLVRRLREATWAVIGLAALAGFKARPKVQ